ncbi:hypothetical protein [Nocardioides sp. SLBN-35]|uniref:hypothetical protein n=1 Tax=Nocardioides sp. SLBN-35 TaxID=2768445 RepID=UPI00114E5540|nr:hypothetical protein [Nocardioides sp. SLBN-35]TQK72787.1 hypothetical protein FBY23_4604 [Nocardioides sp. SLBN-35]
MAGDTEERVRRGPSIDWPATFAGAGAAVTVAVLLSTLGAAGTLIGAALGSVIATVSSALYKQGIETSRRRVAEVQAAALEREAARAHRHVEATEVLDAVDAAEPDEPDGSDGTAPAPGGNRWAALPWKRLALLAGMVFLIAVVAISVVELIAGKSVSTITGGTDGKDHTSIGGVFGGGDDTGKDKQQQELPAEETPTPTPTPSETATVVPTQGTDPATPVDTSTPTETPTPTEPTTPTPTPTPSASVTPSASITP